MGPGGVWDPGDKGPLERFQDVHDRLGDMDVGLQLRARSRFRVALAVLISASENLYFLTNEPPGPCDLGATADARASVVYQRGLFLDHVFAYDGFGKACSAYMQSRSVCANEIRRVFGLHT